MNKKKIGKDKMSAALQRRLDRGAVKAAAKTARAAHVAALRAKWL